jgi:hypothetical protein
MGGDETTREEGGGRGEERGRGRGCK